MSLISRRGLLTTGVAGGGLLLAGRDKLAASSGVQWTG